MPRDYHLPPGKALTGKAALDAATAIAADSGIAGKPENQKALRELRACIARAEAQSKRPKDEGR